MNRIKIWFHDLKNLISKKRITVRKPTFKEWLKNHMKVILVSLGGVIILIALIFAGPKIANQYDTYINIPQHFSAQERDQAMARWKDILSAPKEQRGKNNSSIYNNIGILRGALKDYPAAIRAFKMARARSPQDPRFSRNMAITYTYMQDYGDAEVAFREAMSIAPTAPEYWLELGELYSYYTHEISKAKAFYIQAIEKNMNNPDVLKAYANFEANIDMDYREAMNYWNTLAQKDPANKEQYLKNADEMAKKLQLQ